MDNVIMEDLKIIHKNVHIKWPYNS